MTAGTPFSARQLVEAGRSSSQIASSLASSASIAAVSSFLTCTAWAVGR